MRALLLIHFPLPKPQLYSLLTCIAIHSNAVPVSLPYDPATLGSVRLDPSPDKPIRMQAGSIAHLLLTSSSKSWLTNPARDIPQDTLVEDDVIPKQEVDFKLFDPQEPSQDFNTQTRGIASLAALKALLGAAKPLDEFWRVPIYDMYLSNQEDAVGTLQLNTSNLPPQLASEAEDAGSSDANAVGVALPPPIDITVPLVAPELVNTPGDNGELQTQLNTAAPDLMATEVNYKQHYTSTTRVGCTAVLRVIEDALLLPYVRRALDAITPEYQVGDIIAGDVQSTGETIEIEILKVDIGGRAVRWLEMQELLRRTIVEPAIQNKWYTFEADIAWVTDRKVGEPLLRVSVFKGRRPTELEIPAVEGVVMPVETA